MSTEKKKRGRPSQKSVAKCALPPATSSKRVVSQPAHVVGIIIEDNVSVPVIETTKKKRGRPPMKKPEKCVEASVRVANGSVAGPTRQGVRIPSEENGKNTLQRTDLSAGGSVRPKECHVVIEQSKGLGNTAGRMFYFHCPLFSSYHCLAPVSLPYSSLSNYIRLRIRACIIIFLFWLNDFF